MFTNKKAIYQLKDLAERAHTSLSSGFSDRWIFKEILKYRARLIKQKYRQGISLMQSNFQESLCYNLIEVPKSDCVCSLSPDCTLYRTETIVPKTIIPLKSVYNPSNSKQYQYSDISKLRFRATTRYKGLANKSFYYISDQGKGDYIYVVSENPLLRNIITSGIYENPLEIQTMKNCEGIQNFPCRSFYDYEMRIDESLFTTVQEMVVKNWWSLKMTNPLDLENNGNTEK